MEDFPAEGGSVSTSSSKTVENYYMVGSEATTAGVYRANVFSKIVESRENFHMGLEAIIVKVGATSVSSWV